MHAELAELWKQINAQKTEVLARVEAMSPEKRSQKPKPSAWSPLEIVEHLVKFEEWTWEWVQAGRTKPDSKKSLKGAIYTRLMSALMQAPFPSPTVPELEPTRNVALPEIQARWQTVRAQWENALHDTSGPDAVFAIHPIAGPLHARDLLYLTHVHLVYHQKQLTALAG